MSFNPERRLWRRHIPPLSKVSRGDAGSRLARRGQVRVRAWLAREHRRRARGLELRRKTGGRRGRV